MNSYSAIRLFVPHDDRDTFHALMAGCGFEGCTSVMARIPVWPTGAVKVYNPDGSVNMAASPAPSGWIADGVFNDLALPFLPEYTIVEEDAPNPAARSAAPSRTARASVQPVQPQVKVKVAKLKQPGKPDELLARIQPGPGKPTAAKCKKAVEALHIVRADTERLDEMLARLGYAR